MERCLRLGHIEIELKHRGAEFLGLGRIACGKTVLRAGDLPLRPFTATHDGIEYDRYEIEGITATPRRVVIRTRAVGVGAAVAALQDHSLDPVWSTRAWNRTAVASDRMDWILEADERAIGGRTFTGFSYAFRFRSAAREVCYILDRATWELGGRAAGVTLLRQQMGCDPRVTLAGDTPYSTSAVIAFPLNPIMTHDVPRWASEQGFDYQCRDGAALVGLFDHCGLIRTIVTRTPGDRSIRHFDKHIFDQARDGRTIRKFVGFCPDVGDDTAQLNQWTRVFDADQDNVLGQFGMRRTYPRTTLSHNFWVNFTADRYREDLLPAAAALGFQQVFIDPLWENDMTRTKDGTLPAWFRGNMCCPHEYEVSKAVGGVAGYRRQGVALISWVGSHQSQNSPYLLEHGVQAVKGPDGRHMYGSGYDAIYGMDLSSDFGPMFREAILRAARATGVSGFLYDSFYNFGWMPVNYHTPDVRNPHSPHHGRLQAHTQWRQLAEIMAALQKGGLHMLIESLGPWGQPQHGVRGAYNRPGSEPLAYQCAVSMGYSVIPVPGAQARESDGPEVYYRLLANKAPITLNLWAAAPAGKERLRLDRVAAPLLRQANLDYRAALPLMHTRTLLPDGAGVAWRPARGRRQVIFSFRRQSLPVSARARCLDQTVGGAAECRRGQLFAEPWHTYVIG